MIKIAVTGAAGRMGGRIITAVKETEGVELTGAVERAGHPLIGQDAGSVAGCGPLGVPILDSLDGALADADVLIDFTFPEVTLRNAEVCARLGKKLVTGSTGFTSEQREQMKRHAEAVPVVMAPNMSVGVNVLLTVVEAAAAALGDGFDPEISEIHHRMKVDAPSGTALALGRAVAAGLQRDFDSSKRLAREGIVGTRTDGEIGIVALRGGDVVGDHTVVFAGMGERLELTHRAHSRDCLARGAVRAGIWLASQPVGRYSMRDVLGL